MRRKYSRSTRHKFPAKLILILGIVCIILGGIVLWLRQPAALSRIAVPDVNVFGDKLSLKEYSIVEYVSKLIEDSKWSLEESTINPEKTVVGKVGILSDSHGDIVTFTNVVERLANEQVNYIVHLGDTVDAGESVDMEKIREILQSTGIEYIVLPGDHDYNWYPEHDLSNFLTVYGYKNEQSLNQVKQLFGYSFIFLNNTASANPDLVVDEDLIDWYELALTQAAESASAGIIVFTTVPFESPYFQYKQDYNGQSYLNVSKKYGVTEIFSGNTHIFSRYKDEETEIFTTTVGASGDYKNPLPQYVVVSLFDDGSIDVVAKPGIDVESYD